MKRLRDTGFTTIELLIALAVLIVLTASAYFYGRSGVSIVGVNQPSVTSSPITLLISRNTTPYRPGSGFTIKVDDTSIAVRLLADINALPYATSSKYNCPVGNGDDYTLHFTDPNYTFKASYSGCYLISESGSNNIRTALPASRTGSVFWNELHNATSRPL